MGHEWDGSGVAFDPATWAAVLRVARPGAWMAVFGGTRTHHRLACAIATEFWYAAPVRCILPDELPEGAGLLEVRPWGRDRELRARAVIQAKALDTPNPGPEFWASVLRCLADRRRRVDTA